MKKMTRLGVVVLPGKARLPGDASRRSGKTEAPTAAPTPAAIPCSIFRRLSMIDLSTRISGRCFGSAVWLQGTGGTSLRTRLLTERTSLGAILGSGRASGVGRRQVTWLWEPTP